MWTNNHFSRAATGDPSAHAIAGATDYDFHWTQFADEMRDNDQRVIKMVSSVHIIENSQGNNGRMKKLITYKFPLYDHNRLAGIIGFSFELPDNECKSKLSQRECDCVALLANGLTDKKIADTLCISPRTVETHINSCK